QQKAVLAKALQDEDDQVQLRTQRALESLGSTRLKLQRNIVPNAAPTNPAQPGAPGNTAAPGEQAGEVNQNQAQPGTSPDPLLQTLQATLPSLEANIANPNVQVRLGAVEALEAFGPTAAPASPALIRALADPSLFVRWAASRTLGKLPPAGPT